MELRDWLRRNGGFLHLLCKTISYLVINEDELLLYIQKEFFLLNLFGHLLNFPQGRRRRIKVILNALID